MHGGLHGNLDGGWAHLALKIGPKKGAAESLTAFPQQSCQHHEGQEPQSNISKGRNRLPVSAKPALHLHQYLHLGLRVADPGALLSWDYHNATGDAAALQKGRASQLLPLQPLLWVYRAVTGPLLTSAACSHLCSSVRDVQGYLRLAFCDRLLTSPSLHRLCRKQAWPVLAWNRERHWLGHPADSPRSASNT